MIDALLYAIRDGIRAAGINYDAKTCEIMDDGRPPPVCGNYFAAIHDGKMLSDGDNQLDERYSFVVTLTERVTVPLDRVGDQMMARNIERVPLGERQGFNAKIERLRALLHMNWNFVVIRKAVSGQSSNSANDNLAAWATGTVYGFVEPMRFLGTEFPKLVGGEWFGSEPDAEEVGMMAPLMFGRCKRMQPVTQASGPFV